MRFRSTRGGVAGASFEEAVSLGYAPDGGLFVPEALPRLTTRQLEAWRALPFEALAEAILALFVGEELPHAELRALARNCYAGFGAGVVPVRRVGGLFVAELFHGPTLCFKDFGQQPLVRLLARFAERRGETRTVLVSTTGDTGPAAMRAVSDAASDSLRIVTFFPAGQISELQRRQMTTCSSDRAQVLAFEGSGDDMDAPLKRLAADAAFARQHGLCGINSYNLGRPVAQMTYYFWTYFRVLEQLKLPLGAQIDVVMPAGALGNLTAGFMARQMGLPIRRLVAGTNANDITHRTFASGEFHRSDHMEQTLSDAINIQVPYNMERIFFYLTGENTSLVAEWMSEMDRSGRLTLPKEWLARLQGVFGSERVADPAMCAALHRCLEHHGYLADPHTAVALAAAWRIYGEEAGAVPVVVLATASPCKFEASVTEAVGPAAWAAYEEGAFPPQAREVLTATERPAGLLRSRGSLAASQEAWEAEVRQLLSARADAPGAPGAGRARL